MHRRNRTVEKKKQGVERSKLERGRSCSGTGKEDSGEKEEEEKGLLEGMLVRSSGRNRKHGYQQ